MRWKFSEDKKPAWNRAKGFYRGSKSFFTTLEHYDTSSMKIHGNL